MDAPPRMTTKRIVLRTRCWRPGKPRGVGTPSAEAERGRGSSPVGTRRSAGRCGTALGPRPSLPRPIRDRPRLSGLKPTERAGGRSTPRAADAASAAPASTSDRRLLRRARSPPSPAAGARSPRRAIALLASGAAPSAAGTLPPKPPFHFHARSRPKAPQAPRSASERHGSDRRPD